MNISIDDYRIAQRIFYNLLKTGELKEKTHKDLYLNYINNNNVRNALDCISEESKVKIKLIGGIVYLIPELDNDILGFNVNDSNYKYYLGENTNEVYLSYLIMTVIFSEFTNELSPASYIEIPNILNLVNEVFSRASIKNNLDEIEVNNSFNIKSTKLLWEAKSKWDENSKKGIYTTSSNYQIGYIRRIISFLDKQNLINVINGEDKITPTVRFKNLMNGYFLNEDRKLEIEQLLSIKGDI